VELDREEVVVTETEPRVVFGETGPTSIVFLLSEVPLPLKKERMR